MITFLKYNECVHTGAAHFCCGEKKTPLPVQSNGNRGKNLPVMCFLVRFLSHVF